MADVVSVDSLLDGWYPGWKPEHLDQNWLRAKSGPFTKEDEETFWFVDFHYPRGFSPLGTIFITDVGWATQIAAHQLPLPPAGGLQQRYGGPFLYEGEVPITSEWEVGFRAARIERNLPRFLENFEPIWEERKWEIELGLDYFENFDFAQASLAGLGQYVEDARRFQQRAWEIHFEVMYPLLAIYLQLYGVCAENGIDPANIAKMLQGREHKINETDRKMWDLVDEARRLDITSVFEASEAPDLRSSLGRAGGNASVWLTEFDDFLQVYGHRTEGIGDINIPSWIEDDTSPLGQIKNFIETGERHDFDAGLRAAVEERDEVIEASRSRLNGDDLRRFDELLAVNEVANFAWWNEDHNFYIDLRVSIPIRNGAIAIGERVGVDRVDEATFMFLPELHDVCAGRVEYDDIRSMVRERAAYYDGYQPRRQEVPKVVGPTPDHVDDPVLIEIFGLHDGYFEGLRADAHVTELTGFPASAGVYRGRARVMWSAMELFELEEGEILVTEATSPNWTPAFAIIGACVCDGGGSLTHAATVSREYGIPCVVGTSVGTLRIGTGDLVEVDGTKGVVRILERAATSETRAGDA